MSDIELKEKRTRYRKIGGMSSVDGVMITSDKRSVIATREGGGIDVRNTGLRITEEGCARIPFVRGFLAWFSLITQGTSMLFGDTGSRRKRISLGTVLLALYQVLMFSVTYYVLPILAADGINALVYLLSGASMGIWRGAVENAARILLLGVQYAVTFKLLIKDVTKNHGAEHKAIACYVDRGFVELASARRYSRFNPACGSNLLSYAVVLEFAAGILVRLAFESLGMADPMFFLYLAARFISLPLVIMVSYEIHIAVAKHYNKFTAVLALPGRLLQILTTSEPDPCALEVAVVACRCATDDGFYDFYRRFGKEYTVSFAHGDYLSALLRMSKLNNAYMKYLDERLRQKVALKAMVSAKADTKAAVNDEAKESDNPEEVSSDYARDERIDNESATVKDIPSVSCSGNQTDCNQAPDSNKQSNSDLSKTQTEKEDAEDFIRRRRRELMERLEALSIHMNKEDSKKPEETISDDKKEDT